MCVGHEPKSWIGSVVVSFRFQLLSSTALLLSQVVKGVV